jgi:SSS family solute:Na+ symporter
MMGGISAVVWTDALQSLILIAGTLLCVAILGFSLPDFSTSFSAAFESGKFSLGSFSFSDWGDETFWVIFIYAMFINLQNFGIDQSFTQRYVAAKSLTAAKRSLMSSAFLYLVNTVFFVLIGTMLWMYVQANPGAVPESVLAKSDAVFPWFIVHKLPVGISGLLVAAIVAAAMSTVSSTLNSGATVLLEDYRKRFSSRKDDERANIAFLRSATVGLGVLSIAIGIGVMNVKSALTAFWAFQSVLSGGMLGLFLLAMLSKRSNGIHASVATAVGLFFVAWVTFGQEWTGFSFRLHVNLAIVFGTVALVSTGALLSVLRSR